MQPAAPLLLPFSFRLPAVLDNIAQVTARAVAVLFPRSGVRSAGIFWHSAGPSFWACWTEPGIAWNLRMGRLEAIVDLK